MHKVTSMEAHRVLSVIEDTLEKLSYLSYLPEDPSSAASSDLVTLLSRDSAAQASGALDKMLKLESKLQNRPETDQGQIDTCNVAIRDFCRQVNLSPIAAEALYAAETRNSGIVSLIHQLSQLKSITFRHLSTTIEEETTNRELLHDLDERMQRAERQRERLQASLDRLRTERDREVAVLDQTLSKLEAERQDLSQSNHAEIATIEKDMNEQIERSTNEYNTEKKSLEEDLKNLNAKLADESDEHRELENTQRRLMARKEKDLSEVIENYDRDMAAKQAEIEHLQERMKKERVEFLELQEHFDRVDANMAKKAEEEQIIENLRQREAKAHALLAENAVIIQTMVRVRQTRAEFIKLTSKKGKKGKKGGKKKKK
mmetsp:Transcript_6285/g.24488  ORF Transcript_6285/g.24488 Transcript_6285/m.24488 type:complete len:373 (-) Transcript_6285:7-1125(-)